LANARSTTAATGLSSDDRLLALLPFSHLFGLTVTASAPLMVGGSVITMEHFTPAKAIETIERNGITVVVGVPAVFRALLAVMAHRESTDLSTLRICVCGGSPLPLSVQERWFDVTGVELRQGYGLTEAGPVCLFNRVDAPNARGTLGVPFPGVEVELRAPIIYDDAGNPRVIDRSDPPHADALEICVRGDNVFRGYVSGGAHGLPIRDGWLYTGDLGIRAAGGQIVFAGVTKPMFTRNGFNIYPREIERVVREMPGVQTAIVHAGVDSEREDDIELEVTGRVTEDAVRSWCAEQLAAYKHPATIRVL
jgi:long-chain acyl-CoA synthetase